MGNNSKIAWKAKEQLERFSMKVFHDFSRPERKFVAETVYGIQATGDTLVILDPTDVCKPHARKMEHLTFVRDASRSSKENVVTTRGYHGCMAVACGSGSRKTVPLALKLWSPSGDSGRSR